MSGEPVVATVSVPSRPQPAPLHLAWFAFIRLCREIGHGEIERLVIQDGLPVLAEVTRKKVKFV